MYVEILSARLALLVAVASNQTVEPAPDGAVVEKGLRS